VPARLSSLVRLTDSARSDRELLRAHLDAGDTAAMDELVRRHAKLARRAAAEVCPTAADDVAQATLALLVRKATAIAGRESAAGWVFETARRLALKARAGMARRARHESRAKPLPPAADPLDTITLREVRAAVAEELTRLPDELRLPLVLCYWDGANRSTAAARLGCSVSTLKRRLNDGRDRLAARLARRGFAGPAVLAALTAVQAGADAAGPIAGSAGRGFARWKIVSSVPVAVGVAAVGIGFGVYAPVAADPPEKSAKSDESAPKVIRPGPVVDAFGVPLPEGAIARFGSSPHNVGESAFALTPDEKQIITVSTEGILHRFDAVTGRLLDRSQLTDRSGVAPTGQMDVCLSSDGKTAALGESFGGKQRITVWNVGEGRVRFRPEAGAGVIVGGFVLSPNGRVLAVRERVGERVLLCAYDTATGAKSELGELEYNTYRTHFSADSKRVFVSQISLRAGKDRKTLACFDVPGGKQVWKLPANCDQYAVSSDGGTVVFAQYDRWGFRLIETDLKTGETTQTEHHSNVKQLTAHVNAHVALAPDDRTLLISHFDDLVSWDIRAGQEISRIKLHPTQRTGYVPELGAFSKDGKTVVINRGSLQRWDLAAGKPIFDSVPGDGIGHVAQLAFTPDGKEVFASGQRSPSTRWNVATGKRAALQRELLGHQIVNTPSGLRSVWSDEYKSPHEIVVYDPVAGKAVQTVGWTSEKSIGVNGLRAYALATDGRTLLVLQSDEPARGTLNSHVTSHDIISGRQLSRFTIPGMFNFLQSPFSPCGRWFMFGGKVYHVRTGTDLFTPAGEGAERLALGSQWATQPVWFSPDGRFLAGRLERKTGATTDTLAVWELASGRVLARFSGAGAIAQLTFAPDGRSVALTDGRGVHVHDLLTGKCLADYIASDIVCDAIARGVASQSVAFSPDGRTLATGHRDGSVMLWNVPRPPVREVADDWAALKDSSPEAARAAVDRLVRDAAAYKVVAAKFRPPAEEANPQIASLIADLDSSNYATREAASKKLRELGGTAEPALRKALTTASSPEARRRLDDLLAAIPAAVQALPVSGETLRGVRVVEILERLGTPQARELLQVWANQGRDPRVAAEARLVLGRIGAPSAPSSRN
jgi:RNA polymerase sigma factor (sigma-70 family)